MEKNLFVETNNDHLNDVKMSDSLGVPQAGDSSPLDPVIKIQALVEESVGFPFSDEPEEFHRSGQVDRAQIASLFLTGYYKSYLAVPSALKLRLDTKNSPYEIEEDKYTKGFEKFKSPEDREKFLKQYQFECKALQTMTRVIINLVKDKELRAFFEDALSPMLNKDLSDLEKLGERFEKISRAENQARYDLFKVIVWRVVGRNLWWVILSLVGILTVIVVLSWLCCCSPKRCCCARRRCCGLGPRFVDDEKVKEAVSVRGSLVVRESKGSMRDSERDPQEEKPLIM